MKRILVTGGTGFIGSAIVRKLVQRKNSVRVLDNESRSSQIPTHIPDVQYRNADIRNTEDVAKACEDIDTIIHLAYINGTKFFYEKPGLVLDVGVKGMMNILDGAKKNGVKELFLASSSEVYQTPPIIPTPETVPYFIPDPKNPRYSYAGGKIISELLSLHMGSGIFDRTVIFRPHNVFGPNMGNEHVIPELIRKVVALKKESKDITLPIQGDGSSTRAFIYIDDFVDALMILMEKGTDREIYNIGTEEEISITELVAALAETSGTSIKIEKTRQPEGGVSRRCPDITKISSLGFTPLFDIEKGLQKTYSWYESNSS